MRAELVATACCIVALSAPLAVANELPNRLEIASLVQKDDSGIYKLEWQKRLLAIQHAFAANLISASGIDYSATGSITQTDPTPLQR